MNFEEWANRTFGGNFINEEPITYFRMSAAWENAQNEEREACAMLCDAAGQERDYYATDIAKAIRERSNVKVRGCALLRSPA